MSILCPVNAGSLTGVLDSVDEAVFATDADLNVVSWNAALERLTGISRATALGQPAPALTAVLVDRHEARISPWRGADGTVAGITVTLRRVTQGTLQDRLVQSIEAIGHGLTSSHDLGQVLDTVVRAAMEVMSAEAAMVTGWDGRSEERRVGKESRL